MIGFWNGSVYLTYAGLCGAVAGIFLAFNGKILPALFCLLFAGVCDMFDGKIARAMKRTEDEKLFGIQIDSLCDLVCFGVLPAAIAHAIGVAGIVGEGVLILFVLFGQVRLAYFNVTEAKRQQVESGNRKKYQGVPITSSAVVLPFTYVFHGLLGNAFPYVLTAVMGILALLFVLNISIPKPGKKGGIALVAIGVCIGVCFIVLAAAGKL